MVYTILAWLGVIVLSLLALLFLFFFIFLALTIYWDFQDEQDLKEDIEAEEFKEDLNTTIPSFASWLDTKDKATDDNAYSEWFNTFVNEDYQEYMSNIATMEEYPNDR